VHFVAVIVNYMYKEIKGDLSYLFKLAL